MEYSLAQGWTEHQMRRWYSLRQVKRDYAGSTMLSKAVSTKSQEKSVERDIKRAIIPGRKLRRG
eukprot:8261551-Pyramimonas_sp.AAC.1